MSKLQFIFQRHQTLSNRLKVSTALRRLFHSPERQGVEEERGSLSCAPSNRLQFPSTKEQQTIVVLGASIMCDCRLEQEIGNKTIVSELYKTG